jgi:MFS family permease
VPAFGTRLPTTPIPPVCLLPPRRRHRRVLRRLYRPAKLQQLLFERTNLPAAAIGLAVVFGFGLNGTSSVLYAAVASLVPDGKRGRGYGLYYTVIDVAAAIATFLYGLLADWTGLDWTFAVMALLTLALPLRSRLSGS